MDTIFQTGVSLSTWEQSNKPDLDLYYKDGQTRQLLKVESVVKLFDQKFTTIKVVGRHFSKSVPLPVTCIKFHPYNQVNTYCFIRDNFYDIKLCVVSDGPVKIPYSLTYSEWDEKRLEEERQRYISYKGRFENIDDLKLEVYANDNWYHEKWSGSKIIRKDGRIYVGSKPLKVYCEGIDELGLPDEAFEMYETDKNTFGISLHSYGQLAHVLDYIDRSLERYRSQWLDSGGREKLAAEEKLKDAQPQASTPVVGC